MYLPKDAWSTGMRSEVFAWILTLRQPQVNFPEPIVLAFISNLSPVKCKQNLNINILVTLKQMLNLLIYMGQFVNLFVFDDKEKQARFTL